MNEIRLAGLTVTAHIGVPEEERARPQTLRLEVTMIPRVAFELLGDDITATADYDAAARRIAAVAAGGPRRLIETLAADLAAMLLAEFPLSAVEVEIRKVILPQTDYVAVRCRRTA
jgi:7,8-dihydroneopterin aldolase/epimerase/oxygenase